VVGGEVPGGGVGEGGLGSGGGGGEDDVAAGATGHWFLGGGVSNCL
jgi:hypothetical protein